MKTCTRIVNRPFFILISIFITCLSSVSSAQEFLNIGDSRFELFPHQDFLPHYEVYDVIEDASGFLWIATYYGLVRYNGYEFETIDVRTPDGQGLQDVEISALFLDNEGHIWIGTFDEGLFRYDPRRNKLLSFRYDHNDPSSISSNRIYYKSITQDRAGMICFLAVQGRFRVLHRLSVHPRESMDSDSFSILRYTKVPYPSDLVEFIDSVKEVKEPLALMEAFFTR